MKSRRDNYARDELLGRGSLYKDNEEKNYISFIKLPSSERPLFIHTSVNVSDNIKVKCVHRALQATFVKHQWTNFGGLNPC